MIPKAFSLIVLAPLLFGGATGFTRSQAQSPPETPIADLVRGALTGDIAAERALIERGVSVLERAKPLFGSETVKYRKLVRRIVETELNRAAQRAPGLRFHGQFEYLRAAGPEGVDALLAILLDDDVPVARRRSSALAIGDVGHPRLIPDLERVARDFLTEEWLEREAVFLMARLGKRDRVDQWIRANEAIVGREVNSRSLSIVLAAHTELGEIFYRTREYARSIPHHQKKLVLLRDLRERVGPELVPAVDDEISLVRYNLACAFCLSGEVAKSFEQLDAALRSGDGVTLEMVRNDGDLTRLRADERYEAWVRDWNRRKSKGASEPEKSEEGQSDR